MKKIIIVVMVLSGLAGRAQENGFHIGARGSLGTTNLDFTSTNSEVGKLSFDIGVATQYVFHPNFVASVDFLIGTASAENTGESVETDIFNNTIYYPYNEKFRMAYVEMPIMINPRVKIKDDLFLKGIIGTGVNFFLGGIESRTYSNSNYDNNNGYSERNMTSIESTFMTFVYGGGIDVVHADGRNLFLEARFHQGIQDIGRIDNRSATLDRFKVSIGYTF